MNIRNKILVSLGAILFVQNSALGSQVKQPGSEAVCSFLAGLHWQYRVLVIPLKNETPAPELLAQLRQSKRAIDDRRLKVLFTTSSKLIDSDEDNFNISDAETCKHAVTRDSEQRPFLIGLDGGIKSVYNVYDANVGVNLNAVFADIDGMPMRRSELKNGNRS